MHIATFTTGSYGLFLTFNMISWVFVSLLIAYGFRQLAKSKKIRTTDFLKYVLAGFLLLLIPLLYSNSSTFDFLPTFFGLCAGVLLLFSLYQFDFSKEEKNQIMFILLLAIGIEATLGLLQFYVFNYIDFNMSGYALLNDRPSGVFRQPNLMASFMATGISLSLYLIYQNKNTSIKKIYTTFSYYCLFACIVTLVLLQSKVGYLAAVISLLFSILIIKNNIKHFKKAMATVSLSLLIGILSVSFIQSLDRGEKLYSDEGVRFDIMKVSFNLFSDNLITGVGYGKFERQYLIAHREQMKKDETLKEPIANLRHPHNEVIMWGVEGGIVPILGLLVILFGFIVGFNKKFTAFNLFKLAIIFPISLHCLTELPFYLSTPHFIFFIIFLWLINESVVEVKEKNIKSFLLANTASLAIPLITIPFMVTGIHTSILMANFYKSGYKEPELIGKIKNEFVWFDYIAHLKQEIKLEAAIKSNDIDGMINYVSWVNEYLKLHPNEQLYLKVLNVISVLETKGVSFDKEFVQKFKAEAKVLFPVNNNFN